MVLGLCWSAARGADEKSSLYRIEDAQAEFERAIWPIQDAYRHGVAKALESADRIEIYVLNFEMAKPPEPQSLFERDTDQNDDLFPIVPCKMVSEILKRKLLNKKERGQLITALQTMLNRNTRGSAVGCHFPIEGIRAWSGDQVVFRTSLCFHCGNYTFEYPNGSDIIQMGGNEVEEIMKQLLPVPQSEVDRFKAKYPGTDKAKKKGE